MNVPIREGSVDACRLTTWLSCFSALCVANSHKALKQTGAEQDEAKPFLPTAAGQYLSGPLLITAESVDVDELIREATKAADAALRYGAE
jgi:hypothetical protein